MSNRTKLKSYFVTNAVPTAANFAELIDSGLNPDEDSIKKLSAGPVALEAQGEATGPQEVLHFYKKFSDADAAWKINLNGRVANAGLNFSNTANQSRLFIKESDGSIGVGTTDPKAKLQVAGGNLYVDGKVGIGVAAPNAPLSFPDTLGQKITLWGQSSTASYGFGINNSVLQIHTDTPGSDILFGYGSSTAFTERMRVKGNGNVGIGTNNPLAKLQVAGGAIMPSAGAKKDTGIYFPENAAGGGGDAAWICYYDRPNDATTEGMVLEIGIANDGDDHIALMPSGNVGIGTIDPKAKLHVAGAIHAGTSEIYFTDINHNHSGFGNNLGYAAIENSTGNYDSLMILGRARTQGAVGASRYVTLWDHVDVKGDLKINGVIVNASDVRIKHKITFSDGMKDVELLSKLSVKNYFVKTFLEEKSIQKGFIAQEVEEILPEAVIRHTDFIADIFSRPIDAILQNETLTLTMPQAHELKSGDFVRLQLSTGTKEVNIIVIDDKKFAINDWKEEDISNLFVYGKWVDDFRTVNYNTIFTLGISAIQELSRQVQQLKVEMKGLKDKLSAAFVPAL